MLDVKRLRLLRELKLRGTITAVADALHYSPSAISQQLDLLAREAGTPLLTPVGRRVQLTPAGELLVERTTELLTQLERAESDLERVAGTASGTVRLAVFQSAAHAFLPQTLARLQQTHPALRVTVTEREPELGSFEVAARDFDLVIAEQYPGHTRAHRDQLDRQTLTRDTIRLAAPPASISPADSLEGFRDAAWVMEPEGTAARQWAVQQCRQAGFEPDVRFETADLIAHIRLIQSGVAVGLLPDLLWAGGPPSVRLFDLPGRPQREVFTSARQASVQRPAIAVVREALAGAVAAHSAG
jgi:DNA-binding transcriptional LysR family regulator